MGPTHEYRCTYHNEEHTIWALDVSGACGAFFDAFGHMPDSVIRIYETTGETE